MVKDLFFLFKSKIFIGILLIGGFMRTVKIMITGRFELLPYLITILARYMSYFFPVLLDLLHKRSGRFKIIIVLIVLCDLSKLSLFLQIFILFFLQALIIGVLISVELPYTLLECTPGFLILIPWHFSCF